MPTIISKRGQRRYLAKVMVQRKVYSKLFPDTGIQSKRAAIEWEVETRKLLEKELMATSCLSIAVWMNEYLDEVKSRFSEKTYEEKRLTFRRFIAYTKSPMEKPVEEINREMVRNFFRYLSSSISGHAANKARKNLGAAWRWGERNLEKWPNMPNLFLSIERFKEEKQQRYVPPEEDFWKVYNLAEGQDQIMLLAFYHLGARRSELFNLKWADIDFDRKQVYLQTRKRDGGLEGHWIPMTAQLCQKLSEWSEKRKTMSGLNKEYVFICLSDTAFCEDYFGSRFRKDRIS